MPLYADAGTHYTISEGRITWRTGKYLQNGAEFFRIARRLNPEIRLVPVAERRKPDLEWYQNSGMTGAIPERDSFRL